MRLTSIDLYSNNRQVASLSFKDPRTKNPYIAQNVTGLDADEIVPKFYGTSLDAAMTHHSLSLNKREVVILVALNPQFSEGKSYSDLRDDLYRAVASSRTGLIEIHLKNGLNTVACLSGFITKFESSLFSKSPQVQMTVRCDDGMLRSKDQVELNTVVLASDMTLVDEFSTAPHGFKFNITFDAISESFVIQDQSPPTWQFSVTPGVIGGDTGFIVDDVLYFSSDHTGNTIYVKRGGSTYYLVDKVAIGSTWPIMFPGINDLQFIADGAFTWNEFTYYRTYWGV